MKILFISPCLPYAKIPHAGGKIIYHLIRALSQRGHELGLICICSDKELANAADIERYCRIVDVAISFSYSSLSGKVKKVIKGMMHDPLWLFGRTQREFKKSINRALAYGEWDIAQVEYTETANCIPKRAAIPIVLDAHDIRIRPTERYARRTRCKDWKSAHQFKKVVQEEIAACKNSQLLIVRTEADKKLIQQYVNCNTKIMPHPPGLDMDFNSYQLITRIPGNILFVGCMRRQENIEAVVFFIEEVLPLIRKEIPGVTFTVVGSSPPPTVQKFSNLPGIKITGFVEKLEPYYMAASLFVAPLFIGGGVIVKILDAMAAGLPVISTSIGNEGINARINDEIFIANTANEFAQQAIKILQDNNIGERIATNAKSLMANKYNWNGAISCLEDWYKSILSGKNNARN